ncbi:MAG: hypothetical protein KIS74_03265 [Burkholderiales bacterium]|nr:hypothetical protein [Burkholderiales bacterium]
MARILLLLAIGFVIYLVFRGFFRSQVGEAKPSEARDAEDMVACSICGVNMPRSESKEEGGKVTCRDPSACRHAR